MAETESNIAVLLSHHVLEVGQVVSEAQQIAEESNSLDQLLVGMVLAADHNQLTCHRS